MKGWKRESARHALAAKGIGTGRKAIPAPTHWKRVTSTTYVTYVTDEGFHFTFEPIEDTLTIEETKDGYEAKYLTRDEEPPNPNEFGDESLFLVHYHRDFDIRKDDIIKEDDARALYQGEKIPQEKDYWIFPVEAYIHSGVSLTLKSFKGMLPQGHYEFDTSRVGLVLVSKKEFKSNDKAQKAAETLIETWNQYLSGDVYSCVKETYNKKKEQTDYDVVGGFYGYKYAIEELKTFEGV